MRRKPGTTSSPPLALIGFFKIPEGNNIGMGITVDLGRNASVLSWCSWGRTRGYSNRYGRQWLFHATKHGGPVQPPTPQSMAGSPPAPPPPPPPARVDVDMDNALQLFEEMPPR
ncbi:unnamed protein product [Urochloa humidicola]